MINKHWIRWCRASTRKQFDAAKETYHLHVEGLDRDALKDKQTFAEYRIDGPHITPLASEQYQLDIVINVFVQAKQNNTDLDQLARIAGVFQAAFTPSISVFKFGNGPDDNREELLGCFELIDRIKFNNFGIVDEDLKLEQGTVEGRYQMIL